MITKIRKEVYEQVNPKGRQLTDKYRKRAKI